MKSIFDKTWKFKSVPDRLIQKQQQKYNISYLLSKIFIEYNYSEEEIYNSLTKNKHQYINAQNTLFNLLSNNIIPIINENDTVSTDEIKFGDNDVLAALVGKLINADALILLSTTDGLRANQQNGRTKRISFVNQINKTTFSHIVDQNDNLSSGGMKSKLESARLASNDGIPVIIADGRKENVISEIISGNDEGTFFKPKKN